MACLLRWRVRRRNTLDGFAYQRESPIGVFVLAVLFSAPVEALILALLLPLVWLRAAALLLEVYALIWMCGFVASLAVLPHRLKSGGVRVRYGALADVHIPYALIAQVERERRGAPGGRDGCRFAASEDTVYIAVGGKTDIVLRLREPVSVQRTLTAMPAVRILRIAADNPEEFVAAIQERIAAHVSSAELPAQSSVSSYRIREA